mgnify:CR=1 FL=1
MLTPTTYELNRHQDPELLSHSERQYLTHFTLTFMDRICVYTALGIRTLGTIDCQQEEKNEDLDDLKYRNTRHKFIDVRYKTKSA